MSDFEDPDDIQNDMVVFSKLVHATVGLYIWEYLNTLGFEWSCFTGRRPFRRTLWIYSTGRLAALLTGILMLIQLNAQTKLNCQVLNSSSLFFSYLAFTSTSALIALRVIAIWFWNRAVVMLCVCCWLVTFAFFLYGLVVRRAVWITGVGCVSMGPNLHFASLGAVNASVASDCSLLFMQFVGLLRIGRTRSSGVWKLLYTQGLIWLAVATCVQFFAVFFVNLNFNRVWDRMFLAPAMCTIQVCVSRMYCALADFGDHVDASDEASTNLSFVS